MSLDVQQIIKDTAKELYPEVQKTLAKLKRKDDKIAVQTILTNLSECATQLLLPADESAKISLLKAIDSYRNALSCYEGITAIYAYNLTTRVIGITLSVIAKAAVTAVIL